MESMKYRYLLRRPRRRWENDIKMCLEEITLEVVEWTEPARDKNELVDSCAHLNEPSDFVKCNEPVSNRGTISFTIRIGLCTG